MKTRNCVEWIETKKTLEAEGWAEAEEENDPTPLSAARYTGNPRSGARSVFGTAALSILCGHWRYLHMNAVRGDSLNGGLLGTG